MARPCSRFLRLSRVPCWCKHPQHTFTTPTPSMEKHSMLSSASIRTHEAQLLVRTIQCFHRLLWCLCGCVRTMTDKWHEARAFAVCVRVCERVGIMVDVCERESVWQSIRRQQTPAPRHSSYLIRLGKIKTKFVRKTHAFLFARSLVCQCCQFATNRVGCATSCESFGSEQFSFFFLALSFSNISRLEKKYWKNN